VDDRFLPHNSHLEAAEQFQTLDPHLRRLGKLRYVHRSSLLDRIPRCPGIYTVTGGRQTGKTTLAKQWMAELLQSGVPPESIRYITGDIIDDYHSLIRIVNSIQGQPTPHGLSYLVMDEISYVHGWERGVKYLADAGSLDSTVVLMTGSDSVVIREAVMALPGRRGSQAVTDFQFHPLSFQETTILKGAVSAGERDMLAHSDEPPAGELVSRLFDLFHEYLQHGGFLTAINDRFQNGAISPATLAIYSDWIRGDVLKRMKQERYLLEVVQSLVKRCNTQVTWNSLAKEMSIDHPATVASYVGLLESMGVVVVQPALLEHRLSAAPKKARRILFADPFIHHASAAWVAGRGIYSVEDAVDPALGTQGLVPKLVEAVAVNHYARKYPVFYIKGDVGEVDIAYVNEGRFYPVEVKWTSQIHPAELKQLSKYPNSRLLTRAKEPRNVGAIPTEPLPLAIFRLG